MLATALSLSVAVLLATPPLDAARRANERLDYPATEAAARAATQTPELTRGERREAFDLLARALAAQGRTEEAIGAFEALLTLDPQAPEPDAAPKVRRLYQQAKARHFPPSHVRLDAEVTPGRLLVVLEDPWGRGAEISVHEALGQGLFQRRVLRLDGGEAELTWQAGPTSVFVQVQDAQGKLLASAGSAEAPLLVPPPQASPSVAASPGGDVPTQPPRASLEGPSHAGTAAPGALDVTQRAPGLSTGRVWGWSLLAASGVSAAVGGYLALRSASDSRQAGEATEARRTRALDASARQSARASQLFFGGAALGGGAAAYLLWRPE